MTSIGIFLSTSIQNIQSHIKAIQDKGERISEINSIVDLLNQPIHILLQSGELVDLSLQSGLLRLVTDLLINLIENYGEYLYTQHNNGWKMIQKEWHLLNEQVERFRRKVDLVWPKNDQDFIGAIKWLTENGSNEDLEILEITSQALPRMNAEMRDLLEYCRQRIGKNIENTDPANRQEAIDILDLLHELRGMDKDVPLTYLIHGWGAPSANKFFEIIRSQAATYQNDSFCLLRTSGDYHSQEIQGGQNRVFLDLGQKDDLFFYHHAKRDLLFFPASKKNEKTLLLKWQNRARVVVLDSMGFYARDLISVGKELGLHIYIWDGSSVVKI